MTNTTNTAARFAVGCHYATRSIVDHDHWVTVEVISRTSKTIKARVGGKVRTFRVSTSYDGHEAVRPWVSYSMCPIVTAADEFAPA